MQEFVKKYGKKYSHILGIDVGREPFKWFLASMLFGAPIREETAIKTYRIFEEHGLTDPESIVKAGMERIVELLDKGGYTRYDMKTARKIIEACKKIIQKGGFSSIMKNLNYEELKLAPGIGRGTINIFLRELGVKHEIGEYAALAASQHGVLRNGKIILDGVDEVEAEIAMMKLGRDFCKKRKCKLCPVPCSRPRIYNYYL
ncbi:MAG: hypothetical protein J7K61_06520 [Thermoplasmata archaeon]|nr:hypothetical protein [Thermoplasmata archaeon]